MTKLSQKTESFADLLARWLERSELDAATVKGRIEIGQRLGCSHQTVQNWLAGGLPPDTKLGLLAGALGVGEARLRRLVDHERGEAG